MADTELIALCVEARKRKISYGQLVAGTSKEEQKKIVDRYRRRGQEKENKGKQV